MHARPALRDLWRAALARVDPEILVREWIVAGSPVFRHGRIGVFAVGKAAAAMARGTMTSGFADALVIVPRGIDVPVGLRPFAIEASHPEPDSSSVRAAKAAIAFFRSFGERDTILALVSGGASSLLCLPRAGLTIAAKRRAIRWAMREGEPIESINRLRIGLSAVKGGRLAEATAARVVTLVLADVPRRIWRLTGSAPTISGGKARDRSVLLAHNGSGIEGAAARARSLGLDVEVERKPFSGPAHLAGAHFARRLTRLAEGRKRPVALLAGGETSVTIRTRAGIGGRNQEFALGAGLALTGTASAMILAAGSDGIDGSSRNAGAFVDGSTLARAIGAGVNPRECLERHDSARLLEILGDEFRTGATGTNVADWAFGVAK